MRNLRSQPNRESDQRADSFRGWLYEETYRLWGFDVQKHRVWSDQYQQTNVNTRYPKGCRNIGRNAPKQFRSLDNWSRRVQEISQQFKYILYD